MREIAIAVGYATTLALAAAAGHAGFTTLLDLRAEAEAGTLAALCAAVAAAVAWPRGPLERVQARPRAALEIGSRAAGLFYLLFTAVTVVQNAGPYFAQTSGMAETVMVALFSLPMVVLFATGAMIWSTAGAGFFLSILLARLWLRLARTPASHPGGVHPRAG
ncbi:hypothetical protein [Azospirillum halopraeferens]|uniref:hypothetical protein n=1 Tax=Azospirillum halopraeferens TaxID=34010 RepID=UPI000426BF17|nr:hypothetical protein [Azospirillum halopraeferens]